MDSIAAIEETLTQFTGTESYHYNAITKNAR